MKNLIESIRQRYQPQSEATMMKDDGKMVHNCAKHVEHAEWGKGNTIAEEHADPDRYGNIAWYDIVFEHGVEKGVPINELKVLQAENHMHATKKAKKMSEAEDKANKTPPKEIEGDPGSKHIGSHGNLHVYSSGENGSDEHYYHIHDTSTGKTDKYHHTVYHEGKPWSKNKMVRHFGQGVGSIMHKHHVDNIHEEAQKAKKVMENDGNLANNAKPYDKVTHGDVIAGRLGKDEYGGKKKKVKEETETIEFSLTEEEWDQLDELSKSTLGSYVKKSSRDSRITRKIAADFENKADRARSPGMKAASNELSDKFKSKSFKRQAGMDKAVDRLTKEEVEQVDETIIHAERSYELDEAQKSGNYDAHFKAHMKKSGIKHPGELDTPEKKKAFFNAVDASYKAKNEEVFVEAYMSSDIQDVMAAHKKAGNRISNETSGTRDGKPHHSFVVTTPEGKRTRHIYHGSTKKLETMSPAAKSKESSEQDLDDK